MDDGSGGDVGQSNEGKRIVAVGIEARERDGAGGENVVSHGTFLEDLDKRKGGF